MPLLVDPYLEQKYSRATSRLEIESDIVWSILVLGYEGLDD